MAAKIPNTRRVTYTYPGGTITAPWGLMKAMFPGFQPKWRVSRLTDTEVEGRRKYAARQASNAAAGEPMKVVLDNGRNYTLRVTGSHLDFVDQLLAQVNSERILMVYSQKGTIYGPGATDD